ncbi:MAG: wax ester/triacylglycerol synthase family O-acyltransferase [Deltaproteobacteria bacterium]|nr:wax ester/triacylglycerol synthase family O-acyltransferase [Deltaproteobacteria bacterium]
MSVERLRGADAAYFYLETPSQHMHVTAAMLFEPPSVRLPGGEAPDVQMIAAATAERLARRLAAEPTFRKRIVEAPLTLIHPAWVQASEFDLRDHLRLVTLPAPGSREQLMEHVGRIAGSPLARERPLWELWALAGVEGGLVGIVLKVHHAMIDGVSGVELLGRLFADAYLIDAPEAAADGPIEPSLLELAGAALSSALALPLRAYRVLARTAGAIGPVLRTAIENANVDASPTLPFSAPRTLLNRALTSERRVAFGSVALGAVKEVKAAFGVTVNDVVLAACALALGDYLRAHGETPRQALVASVPVSEHGPGGSDSATNRVSVMFVGLPVHLTRVEDVLAFVHAQASGAKRIHGSFGAAMLAEWVDLAPPALFAAAMGLYSRWGLADRLPPPHSVVISNVPGPPFPVAAGNARLVAAFPIGPVLEGAGLNISVLSYVDAVNVGLVTCPRAISEPADLARGFERAVAEMQRAARRREGTTAARASRAGARGAASPRI